MGGSDCVDEAGDSSCEALRRRFRWASSACGGFKIDDTPTIRVIDGKDLPPALSGAGGRGGSSKARAGFRDCPSAVGGVIDTLRMPEIGRAAEGLGGGELLCLPAAPLLPSLVGFPGGPWSAGRSDM